MHVKSPWKPENWAERMPLSSSTASALLCLCFEPWSNSVYECVYVCTVRHVCVCVVLCVPCWSVYAYLVLTALRPYSSMIRLCKKSAQASLSTVSNEYSSYTNAHKRSLLSNHCSPRLESRLERIHRTGLSTLVHNRALIFSGQILKSFHFLDCLHW